MGVRGTVGTMGSAIGVLVFSSLVGTFSVNLSLRLVGIFVLSFAIFIWFIWNYAMER
ncbi:MAG: hypothetical protein ACLFSM_07850 [Thermoplasmata archaeon]